MGTAASTQFDEVFHEVSDVSVRQVAVNTATGTVVTCVLGFAKESEAAPAADSLAKPFESPPETAAASVTMTMASLAEPPEAMAPVPVVLAAGVRKPEKRKSLPVRLASVTDSEKVTWTVVTEASPAESTAGPALSVAMVAEPSATMNEPSPSWRVAPVY